MNVKEAINLRKSIRKYQDKQIPEEIIVELLMPREKSHRPKTRSLIDILLSMIRGPKIN